MGGCSLGGATSSKKEEFHEWYVGNDNFDILLFYSGEGKYFDRGLQRVLNNLWKDLDYRFPILQEYPLDPVFDENIRKLYRDRVVYGVPYYLMREVFLKIFRVTKTPDYSLDAPGLESKHINSGARRFLTDKGMEMSIGIYERIMREYHLLINPVYLHKVIQLALWHFSENEVFEILQIMILKQAEEGQSFPHVYFVEKEEGFEEFIEDVRGEAGRLLGDKIKDCIENLLVDILPAQFYTYVLSQFMIGGLKGVTRLISTILRLFFTYMGNQGDSGLDEAFMKFCNQDLNLYALISVHNLSNPYR